MSAGAARAGSASAGSSVAFDSSVPTVAGRCTWRVNGFSNLDFAETSKPLRSPVFAVGNHRFLIEMVLGGHLDNPKDDEDLADKKACVAIFVQLVSVSPVKIKSTIRVAAADHNKLWGSHGASEIETGGGWGSAKMFNRAAVLAAASRNADSITVSAEVTAIGQLAHEAVTRHSDRSLQSLLTDMHSLFSDAASRSAPAVRI
jgi:hypothetical protein